MADGMLGPFGDEAVATLIAVTVSVLISVLTWAWGRYGASLKHQYVHWEVVKSTQALNPTGPAPGTESAHPCASPSQDLQTGGEIEGCRTLLRLYNEGPRTVYRPTISFQLNPEAEITEVRTTIVPSMDTREESEVHVNWQASEFSITPGQIHPYDITKEQVQVTILTSRKPTRLDPLGYGELKDGSIWVVAARPTSVGQALSPSTVVSCLFSANLLLIGIIALLDSLTQTALRAGLHGAGSRPEDCVAGVRVGQPLLH